MEKTSCAIKIEMGRHLIHNLIYPAVLGTFMFEIINYWNQSKFLNSGLAICLIVFYCCDYIYTYTTKIYVATYIICDIIVISSLAISFNVLQLSEKNQTLENLDLDTLLLSFGSFPFIFLLWDLTCICKYKKRIKNGMQATYKRKARYVFYIDLIVWELIILSWLGTLFWFHNYTDVTNEVLAYLFAFSVLGSSIFYFKWAIKKKQLFG